MIALVVGLAAWLLAAAVGIALVLTVAAYGAAFWMLGGALAGWARSRWSGKEMR